MATWEVHKLYRSNADWDYDWRSSRLAAEMMHGNVHSR